MFPRLCCPDVWLSDVVPQLQWVLAGGHNVTIDRGDLETVITFEVRGLRASERQLSRQFEQLQYAPDGERFEFVRSLWELERKASLVEQLIHSLDAPEDGNGSAVDESI
jgi:hypothetical protein